MSRAAFRQADMERIIRAAECQGADVQVDLRTLVVTVITKPVRHEVLDEKPKKKRILPQGNFAPDGKDFCDED